ncbi:MAG TPA: hypothetical protein VLM89_09465 [Phycisphaerae bacterium]|nr:hypothetical protein [Phycisphaerae bacterium]
MSPSPAFDKGMSCGECSAVVYQEHLDRGLAGYRDDVLYCPHCLAERKKLETRTPPPDAETLALVDMPPSGDRSGQTSLLGTAAPIAAESLIGESARYKRPLKQTGRGASRMRVFHAKMSDAGIRNIENLINEWLDANPEVEIKFSTSTVGPWEGKHVETHLIVCVYY